MPLDDGIWRYTESDVASPTFSELLNRLGDSVRARLAIVDTPWTDVAPLPGYVGSAPNLSQLQVRLRGGEVRWRGRVFGSFPAATQVTITNSVPGWAQPSTYVDTASPVSSGISTGYAAVSAGTIVVRFETAVSSFFIKGLSGYEVS